MWRASCTTSHGIGGGELVGVGDRRSAVRAGKPRQAGLRVLAARLLGQGVKRQQVAERSPQVLPRLDHVKHPVVDQERRGLEAVRKLLVDRLFDHRRTCKADVRARLGDQYVPERGVGGAHAAVRRVGQQ